MLVAAAAIGCERVVSLDLVDAPAADQIYHPDAEIDASIDAGPDAAPDAPAADAPSD